MVSLLSIIIAFELAEHSTPSFPKKQAQNDLLQKTFVFQTGKVRRFQTEVPDERLFFQIPAVCADTSQIGDCHISAPFQKRGGTTGSCAALAVDKDRSLRIRDKVGNVKNGLQRKVFAAGNMPTGILPRGSDIQQNSPVRIPELLQTGLHIGFLKQTCNAQILFLKCVPFRQR